eukprot:CAMPEP_0177531298 /NCGR_PEP_ID=MMETSP0369-20130122/53933_1 /TAXON_ID=447022 ORGANISM="Scrippsiella hangoei-like, Strain SHHI-4" /NCGR_SAMPLE_ID=MMETSP0369 /ASSEMBLY_ACC=CAM_ASM_000364 /LENGTH=82 /DNA_ID=CAMNT_0019012361 /DNA_START=1 /DNA_END=249 /DNA_ORIENTATION=+
MGSGASRQGAAYKVQEATSSSSEEEIAAALRELPEESRQRLENALTVACKEAGGNVSGEAVAAPVADGVPTWSSVAHDTDEK